MYRRTFVALEGLKEIYQCTGCQLLVVLGGNGDHHLEVGPDVVLQHCPEALNGVLHREGTEVVHEPFPVQEVGVHHGAFDVVHIIVVLQGLCVCGGGGYVCGSDLHLQSDPLQVEWMTRTQ